MNEGWFLHWATEVVVVHVKEAENDLSNMLFPLYSQQEGLEDWWELGFILFSIPILMFAESSKELVKFIDWLNFDVVGFTNQLEVELADRPHKMLPIHIIKNIHYFDSSQYICRCGGLQHNTAGDEKNMTSRLE